MKKIVFTSALVGLVAMHSSAADLPPKERILARIRLELGARQGE